jgi:hypothetical protein
VALLERPVRELGQIPGGRGRFERVAQAQPGVPDADLGHDVERAATGERDRQFGEGLQAAPEPGRRPADALGDRLELADVRRDQRQDAIGFARSKRERTIASVT